MTKFLVVLMGLFLFPSFGIGQLYQQNWRDYVPSPASLEWMPVKTVRINIHFVSKSDGSGNFDEETGRKFARDLVAAANGLLANNQPMNLPKGTQKETLPSSEFRPVVCPLRIGWQKSFSRLRAGRSSP